LKDGKFIGNNVEAYERLIGRKNSTGKLRRSLESQVKGNLPGIESSQERWECEFKT